MGRFVEHDHTAARQSILAKVLSANHGEIKNKTAQDGLFTTRGQRRNSRFLNLEREIMKHLSRPHGTNLSFILANSLSRARCRTEAFPFSLSASACSASTLDTLSCAAIAALLASREEASTAAACSCAATSNFLPMRRGAIGREIAMRAGTTVSPRKHSEHDIDYTIDSLGSALTSPTPCKTSFDHGSLCARSFSSYFTAQRYYLRHIRRREDSFPREHREMAHFRARPAPKKEDPLFGTLGDGRSFKSSTRVTADAEEQSYMEKTSH